MTDPATHLEQRDHDRWPIGDEGPHAPTTDRDPALAQASICRRHGIRRQFEFGGQNPDGRQPVTGEEFVIGDSSFDINRQLDSAATPHLKAPLRATLDSLQ